MGVRARRASTREMNGDRASGIDLRELCVSTAQQKQRHTYPPEREGSTLSLPHHSTIISPGGKAGTASRGETLDAACQNGAVTFTIYGGHARPDGRLACPACIEAVLNHRSG